mmetsp:Transcript_21949/g.45946  ORF Transcript_21949/g.45946 Transcript_21949/m.45946 type:complete len:333 (+) Transcript_21949:150-1148(+)
MSTSNEEKSMSDRKYDANNISRYDELLQNYHDAVCCIKQCETIIRALEEEVGSKNETITTLEEKIVQMSLELASSKAFEDEYRSKRRTSSDIKSVDDGSNDGNNNISDDDVCPLTSLTDKQLLGRANSMDIEELTRPNRWVSCAGNPPPRSTNMSLDNNDYSSHRLSGFGQRFRKNRGEREFNTSTMSSITDCGDLSLLDASSWASGDGMDSRGQQRCAFDDSSSTLLSNFDFGQLFHRKNHPSKVNVNVQKKEDKEGGDGDECPPRRRPNRSRLQQHESSRTLLGSAVLFPVSFEDCLEGCVERVVDKGLRSTPSINKGLKILSKEELEQF